MLDQNKGAKPLYMQVKENIYNSIKEEKWKPGDLIPPEKELQKLFDVSRVTVRQAIQELVNENVLTRRSGIGTKVLEPVTNDKQFSTIVKSFSREMLETGHDPQTYYAKLNNVKPNEMLMRVFGDELSKNKKLYRLDRVRGYERKKIVFFESFICTYIDVSQMAVDTEFSLYSMFKEAGINLSIFEERITAKLAGKKVSKYLNLEPGDPVLVRERLSKDQNDVITEFTLGYYDPKLYEYKVNIL